jgi:hypothetical protein
VLLWRSRSAIVVLHLPVDGATCSRLGATALLHRQLHHLLLPPLSNGHCRKQKLLLLLLLVVCMTCQGILDPKIELVKLEKKLAEAAGRADAVRKKMALPSYQVSTC